MMGSQVCWQLLLVWALLLGQPVRGMEVDQEPLLEQGGPPSEEAPPLEQGNVDQPEQSEEELEQIAIDQRNSMMEDGAYAHWAEHFGDMALDSYNRNGDGDLYKSVERNVTFEKAVGNIIHLGVYLAKTSCTKEDVLMNQQHSGRYYDILEQIEMMDQPMPKLNPCDLPPESAQENLDCRFNIFSEQKFHWRAVLDHTCIPMQVLQDF